jgi:hypothetical protein
VLAWRRSVSMIAEPWSVGYPHPPMPLVTR